MNSRESLNELLCEILGSDNVYYQPPASIRMKYPAIVYSRYNMYDKNADNNHYIHAVQYKVIVIDSNPDSATVDKLSHMPKFKFSQHYIADNLNHDVFTIYY